MRPKQTKEGCWWKGQFIEAYAGCQPNVSPDFNRGGLPGLSRTLKADSEAHAAGVCVEYYDNYDDMERNYNVFSLEKDGKWGGGGSCGTGYDQGIYITVQYADSRLEKVMVSTFYEPFESMMDKLITSLPGVDNPDAVYEMLVPIYKSVIVEPVIPAWEELPDVLRQPWRRPLRKGRKIYRIRKLTPRECFRLMGVSEEDIDKIQAYPFHYLLEYPSYSREEKLAGMSDAEKRAKMKDKISDSQQYKMAGNSIVVDVLAAIFTQMFRKDTDALF